jgi:hypothetical protein
VGTSASTAVPTDVAIADVPVRAPVDLVTQGARALIGHAPARPKVWVGRSVSTTSAHWFEASHRRHECAVGTPERSRTAGFFEVREEFTFGLPFGHPAFELGQPCLAMLPTDHQMPMT